MTTYSYAQLEGLWDQAGGPTNQAPTAAAIAEAESGGNPDAAYPGQTIAPGTGSNTDATGLWQILGVPSGFTPSELTNPLDNAEMAVTKYTQAGDSFSPWQTYTSGAYEQYVQSHVSPTSVSTEGTTKEQPSSNCPSFSILHPSTYFSSAECNAAEGFVDWVLQSLGLADLSDLLERGALILLGAVFLFIGAIKLSEGGAQKLEIKPSIPSGTAGESGEESLAADAAGMA